MGAGGCRVSLRLRNDFAGSAELAVPVDPSKCYSDRYNWSNQGKKAAGDLAADTWTIDYNEIDSDSVQQAPRIDCLQKSCPIDAVDVSLNKPTSHT